MHRTAFHIRPQRVQAEEPLAAIEQGLRLADGLCTIEQGQRATVIVDVFQIHQAFNAAVHQPARRFHFLVVMDPVAAFARRFLVADGQRQQGLELADAQFLPHRINRYGEAEDFPQRSFVVQVQGLQIGQQAADSASLNAGSLTRAGRIWLPTLLFSHSRSSTG